ncbi:MAG: tRNA (adenosine(37)-N6)-dimethylallyltransferase MiaA [Sciscionella sp.]
MRGRALAVLGPTATGKSELALWLAQRLDGEVINADAMQLYRGMDIGTAKLPPEERRGIPHHLLDVLEVTEAASVAAYQRQARATLEGLLAAGRTAIVVGGSGLYVQAIFDELEFPGTDPELRARLLAEVRRRGAAVLHERLTLVDPVAAAHILPSNGRRIARALEVYELTGRPFPATIPKPGAARYDATLIGLDQAVERLDERVDRRAEAMFGCGLLEEVRRLCARDFRAGSTAPRALGYAQALQVIDSTCDTAEAIAATARATRRFVRRQRSWFRRDPRIQWLDSAAVDLREQALATALGRPSDPESHGRGGRE